MIWLSVFKNLRAFLFICVHGRCKILSLETICLTVESVTRTKIAAYLNPTIVFLELKLAAVALTRLECLPCTALSLHCAAVPCDILAQVFMNVHVALPGGEREPQR